MRGGTSYALAFVVAVGTVIGGIALPAAAAPLPVPSAPMKAPTPGMWHGTSTNMSRTFNYGPVSFRVSRGAIADFLIEGVTVSGCGGYTSIAVPRLTITGTKVAGSYQPVPGIDDIITVTGSFAGGAIRGTFTEGPLCSGAGRFIARPG